MSCFPPFFDFGLKLETESINIAISLILIQCFDKFESFEIDGLGWLIGN